MNDKELVSVIKNMDSYIERLENRVVNIESDNAKTKNNKVNAINGGNETNNTKALDSAMLDLFKSKTKKSLTEVIETKSMSTDPATGGESIEEQLSSELIQWAIDNQRLLQEIGYQSVPDGSPYYKPVLLQRPTVEQTAENINGDATADTQGITLGRLQCDFAKCYSQPSFTNEIIQDSVLDVVSETRRMISEEYSFHFINQVLFGTQSIDPLQIRGILTDRIDAQNNYAIALQEDDVRDKEYYKVIKTGVNGGLPATSEAILDFLIDVQTDLPQMYQQNNPKWYMSRETFGILRKIKISEDGTDLRPLLSNDFGTLNNTFTLLGKEIVIVDQMPSFDGVTVNTPIIYGDLMGAFEFVRVENSNVSVVDPYTIKGQVAYYNEQRFGGLMRNYDGIRIVLASV
ncbi:phage major capsid protein [Photobacterium swingsii]|uniref:phage major capsid protein n=1 Tax=Photobacterium swingsii TaxID=680026 RepID=UPI00352DDDC2